MEFDVIVVGAGLSGIAAGHYLKTLCPERSFTILEARDAIGGTWDLFRYPGVRSDSDMFTLGYSFRPWQSDAAFASGPLIREYVRDTAREEGLLEKIRFGHRVTHAEWRTEHARWSVEAHTDAGVQRFTCRFLFFCSGYYDYEQGHEPSFEGREAFEGAIVHPQHWPNDLDHAAKRVVVIGSGATAVTLVPEMAQTAQHVTMLQRSPTYIIALPAKDRVGMLLRKALPGRVAYRLVRWKNVAMASAFFQFSRHFPRQAKRLILHGARRLLGPDFDVRKHLSPAYDPWDQRLCIAPDADLFRALRAGKASIVTDGIRRFTRTGIELESGRELAADIIVTATGLRLKLLGGATLSLDGRPLEVAKSVVYRGVMYSGVPNLAVATGYTNASWTLKCELAARYVCRVLNHMRATDRDVCMPVHEHPEAATRPFIELSSGYVRRSADHLPRQDARKPWRLYQNYLLDLLSLRYSRMEDGALKFTRGPR